MQHEVGGQLCHWKQVNVNIHSRNRARTYLLDEGIDRPARRETLGRNVGLGVVLTRLEERAGTVKETPAVDDVGCESRREDSSLGYCNYACERRE